MNGVALSIDIWLDCVQPKLPSEIRTFIRPVDGTAVDIGRCAVLWVV